MNVLEFFFIENKINIKYAYRILIPKSWKPKTKITECSTESDFVDHYFTETLNFEIT